MKNVSLLQTLKYVGTHNLIYTFYILIENYLQIHLSVYLQVYLFLFRVIL